MGGGYLVCHGCDKEELQNGQGYLDDAVNQIVEYYSGMYKSTDTGKSSSLPIFASFIFFLFFFFLELRFLSKLLAHRCWRSQEASLRVVDSVSTTESKDKMEGRFLLNVVVRKSSSVLELLTSEDKSLLIRRDAFLVLDFGLDVLDGVGWLNVEGDGFTSESLNEDLHTTSESEYKMESRLLLDVVIGEGAAIL